MMVGFATDITESKIQNKFLKVNNSTRNYRKCSSRYLSSGAQFQIIINNDAACEMLGLSQEQLLGKTSLMPTGK
jgi:PAS domain-containing protein